MANVFYNMGCPPRHKVTIDIKPLGNYVLYGPRDVANYFGCELKDLKKEVKKYLNNNQLNLSNAPKGYMVAYRIFYDGFEIGSKVNVEYVKETNIDNLLTVLCRTIDGLYIPNRPIDANNIDMDFSLLFLESEVRNG